MSDWLTFTDADRQLADAFRIARLTMAIPTLQQVLLHLDLENTLHIHCYDAESLTSLQLFSRDLQQQVYLILGCREVRLWKDKDPVAEYSLESIADMIFEEPIMVATIERPAMTEETSATADKTASAPVQTSLPGQTLAAIAQDTEQDINEIRAWCKENGWMIIPFGDQEVIPGEAAIAAFDWFVQILIQQRKAKRGLLGPSAMPQANGRVEAMQEPEIAAPTETAPEPEAKKERGLALAAGFKTKVTKNNTRGNLLKALPANEVVRTEYLAEITSGSEKGAAFIDKIASTIVARFGGDKEKLIENLMAMAAKLQAEPAKAS